MGGIPEQTRFPSEASFSGMPKKITAILETESDRGVVLVLAAYLHELLGLIVGAACVSDEDAESILEYRGPAGGFDLRIRLCRAFALIHPVEAAGLEAVRKIRNLAAHFDSKRGFNVLFDSQQTVALVGNVIESQNFRLSSREPESVREAYILAVRLLASKLWTRLLDTNRPKPLLTIKEMANQWREKMKETEFGKFMAALQKEGDMNAMADVIKAMGEVIQEEFQHREMAENISDDDVETP